MQDLALARSDPGTDPVTQHTRPPLRPPDDVPAPHALGSIESARLLRLLDLLEAVDTEQQFRDLLDGAMQGVLPHRGLACVTGRVLSEPAGIAPRCVWLHGFPTAYLESLRQPSGLLRSALTDRWLHTRKPVLVELLHDTRSWPVAWVQGARRHGFTNFALHSFLDAASNTFTDLCFADAAGRLAPKDARRHGFANFASHSFFEATTFTDFCFADVAGRLAPKHAHILRLLVPHLHLALVRIAGIGTPLPTPCQALHPHQLDILRWLNVGKTNWEISMILGMTVHNVKYHVAQLLVKLDAANRVHAVARARERGLLDDRPPMLRALQEQPR